MVFEHQLKQLKRKCQQRKAQKSPDLGGSNIARILVISVLQTVVVARPQLPLWPGRSERLQSAEIIERKFTHDEAKMPFSN